jgi:hypothetical protein
MVKLGILAIAVVATLVGACSSRQPVSCKERPLSRREIIDITGKEIKKRDGNPESIKTSIIKIRRDGCDYSLSNSSP